MEILVREFPQEIPFEQKNNFSENTSSSNSPLKVDSEDEEYLNQNEPPQQDEECNHEYTDCNDEIICQLCGLSFERKVYSSREWNSITDSKKGLKSYNSSKNSKGNIRNILSNVEGSEKLKKETQENYILSTSDETRRTKNRKALAAACYLKSLHSQTGKCDIEGVKNKFDLGKSQINLGITMLQKSGIKINISSKPIDLIEQTMTKTDCPLQYLTAVKKFCQMLEGTSAMLNHSAPQSVAAAVVYYFFSQRKNPEDRPNKSVFANKIELSEITITKLEKEIIQKMEEIKKKKNISN